MVKKGYPKKSRRKMTYHGRSGYPVIHLSETGKKYIMVRKKGGGTKRLYLRGKRRKLYSRKGYGVSSRKRRK